MILCNELREALFKKDVFSYKQSRLKMTCKNRTEKKQKRNGRSNLFYKEPTN